MQERLKIEPLCVPQAEAGKRGLFIFRLANIKSEPIHNLVEFACPSVVFWRWGKSRDSGRCRHNRSDGMNQFKLMSENPSNHTILYTFDQADNQLFLTSRPRPVFRKVL